jgi:hypothetical protein
MFFALNISAFSQIPFQSGFPIIFEDEQTFNPIVIDHLIPTMDEKQLLTILGTYESGPNPCKIVCYSSNGSLIWERVLNPLGFYKPFSIKPAIADIDNDGDKEVVVACASGIEHGHIVYTLNVFNHDGTDYGNGWPLSGFLNLSNVSIGNIDNDDDLEIVVIQNSNQIAVYHHNTNMATGWPFNLTNSWPSHWATPSIADLDFDNQSEIIVVSSLSSTPGSYIGVFDNQGNILQGWPKLLNKRVRNTSQIIDEINPNNSTLEFVVTDEGLSTVYIYDMYGNPAPGWPITIENDDGYTSDNIYFAAGNNDGEIEYTETDGTASSPIAIGDLQSNGHKQVIVAGMNKIHIFNHDGSEYEPLPTLIFDAETVFSPSLADVNSDESIDLIFVYYESDLVTNTAWQKLTAFDNSGNLLDDFPITIREFDISQYFTLVFRDFIPTIDDIDFDGDLEIAISGFRYFMSNPDFMGMLGVYDLNSVYDFEKVEFSDILKNNWNNGLYCNYIENNLSGYNIFYDNVRLTNDVLVQPSEAIKFVAETRITANNLELEVQGEAFVYEDCYFTSLVGESWEGLKIDNEAFDMNINDVLFRNCFLSGISKSLTVRNSYFNTSAIKYSKGDLNVGNSLFDNSAISAKFGSSKSSIVEINEGTVIKNFEGESALYIEGYANYDIDDCTVESNNTDGISIFNSGYARGVKNIRNNTIINNGYNNNGAGLKLYNSYANISGDQLIESNYYGILSLDYSNVSIRGNSEANYTYETQLIRDNNKHQIYATQNSFPFYIKWNGIIDEDNTTALVYYSSSIEEVLDVSYNYWGLNFDPESDLYPFSFYTYLPIWELNSGSGGADGDETLYNSAQDKIVQEDFTGAVSDFQQLIIDYPSSKYSQAALRELFSIEEFASNDYSNLKAYYTTNVNVQNNPTLAKLAEYLANFCEIKLGNFPTAIAWFENIIQNPETLEDSIFAIIDIGYTYFIMENGGLKFAYAGSLIEHIPQSVNQFEEKRDYLLSLLFKDAEQNENLEKGLNNLKCGELLQNIPNPFRGITMIHYKIESFASVDIEIYDYTGKMICKIPEGYKDKGTYSIDFNANGMSEGIYFYSIKIDGVFSDTKKMSVIN